jgi:CBS domain containing-hemolysin-like protein
LIARLLERPEDTLALIVLGNTLANSLLVATGLWMALRGQWSVGWTLAGLLGGILVLCEVVPKTLAVRLPGTWALRIARPLWTLQVLLWPLRAGAQRLNAALLRLCLSRWLKPQADASEEEYQELLELGFQQGSLAASEKEIILKILELDRRTVGEVMQPRAQMVCISDDLSVEEMIEAARRHKHRRLPIYDESTDTIVGILNTRVLLLNPQVELSEAIEFPSFVPESMNLLQLFKSLQRQQRGLAIVLDEFGGTAGLVTMEDILESLIGRIRQPDEPQGFVMEKLAPGRWRVAGTMRVEDFRREHPALVRVLGVDTMGGLLVHVLGVVPQAGESASVNGLRLTAQVVDERRVRELLVEQLA